MGRNLKYQYNYCINNCFREGMDKHSIKHSEGLGTSKIFSYADRKNMLDVASNFSNFMKENYSSIKKVKDVKGEHIQAFLNSKAKDCSKKTLEQYASKFSKLAKCVNNTYNTSVLYSGFTVPNGKENTKKIRDIAMSEEDFSKLESYFKDKKTSAKVAIQLSKRLGLRASECAKLQGRDINIDNGYIHVADSKGKRSRDVKINTNDIEYFKSLKANYSEFERLCPVQVDSINKSLRRALEALNLANKYTDTSIHAIRKLYAQTEFDKLRTNYTIKDSWAEVSEQLGHGRGRVNLMEAYILNIH